MSTPVVQDSSEQCLRSLVDFIWTKHEQAVPALAQLFDTQQDITRDVERCEVVRGGIHVTRVELIRRAYAVATMGFQGLHAKIHCLKEADVPLLPLLPEPLQMLVGTLIANLPTASSVRQQSQTANRGRNRQASSIK